MYHAMYSMCSGFTLLVVIATPVQVYSQQFVESIQKLDIEVIKRNELKLKLCFKFPFYLIHSQLLLIIINMP